MVKVQASEVLGRVVDRGVQLFGGMAFCKELPIERYYRGARIYRIFDGTSEIHRTVVAKSVLSKGPSVFQMHRLAWCAVRSALTPTLSRTRVPHAERPLLDGRAALPGRSALFVRAALDRPAHSHRVHSRRHPVR
jgi:hypothetical protein